MNSHMFRRALFGLILIGAGVLFLLQQMGMISLDIGYLFRTYWPLFIIYAGLHGILANSRHRHGWPGAYIWNVIVVMVGLVFLGRTTSYFPNLSFGDIVKYIIPLGLIAVGLTMFLRPSGGGRSGDREDWRRRRREWRDEWKAQKRQWRAQHEYWKSHRRDWKDRHGEWSAYEHDFKAYEHDFKKFEQDMKQGSAPPDAEPPVPPTPPQVREASYAPPPPPPPPPRHGDDGGRRTNVEYQSGFIGDVFVGRDYWELAPLNVSHFIGDIVIDLTKAQIPYGETKVNVSSFIGDVKVFVPNDMELEVSVTSSYVIGDTVIFDRRDNGFFRSFTEETPHYADAEKKIRLNVSLFIGDIKVLRVG